MASIHKDPRGKSKYFYCSYKAADGRWLFRSTKKTDRTKALKVCLEVEAAELEAAEGRLTEARARELISDIVKRTTGSPLEFSSSGGFCKEWLKDKIAQGDLSENSKISYKHVIELFITHLGDKAEKNIAHVTSGDIQSFKLSRISAGLAPKTIDRDLKVVRSIFKQARARGVIAFDPTQAIQLLSKKSKKKSQVVSREIFTPTELDDIAAKAKTEWKTAIFIARYTGARLGDCVKMQWKNVNLDKEIIEYSDQKTQKDYKIPIHPRLQKYLLSLPSSDNPEAYLSPTLATKKSGGKYGLSTAFRRIMAEAKIDDRSIKTKAVQKTEGKERHLARRSFHCIRHSYNSELANAGTSQEVRRKLVGHSSDEINDLYSHLDIQLFRQAINKLL